MDQQGTLGREPAVVIGAITAAVNAAIVLLFAFVSGFTAEQQAAVLAFATALTALGGAAATRSRVSPAAKAPSAAARPAPAGAAPSEACVAGA